MQVFFPSPSLHAWKQINTVSYHVITGCALCIRQQQQESPSQCALCDINCMKLSMQIHPSNADKEPRRAKLLSTSVCNKRKKKNRMGTMATFIKSARADIYARSFFFKRCFLCRLCMLLYQSYTTHTHWHTDTHKHTQPTVTADNTHGEGPSTRQKCFILRVSACTHLARIAACTRTMQAFLNLK